MYDWQNLWLKSVKVIFDLYLYVYSLFHFNYELLEFKYLNSDTSFAQNDNVLLTK